MPWRSKKHAETTAQGRRNDPTSTPRPSPPKPSSVPPRVCSGPATPHPLIHRSRSLPPLPDLCASQLCGDELPPLRRRPPLPSLPSTRTSGDPQPHIAPCPALPGPLHPLHPHRSRQLLFLARPRRPPLRLRPARGEPSRPTRPRGLCRLGGGRLFAALPSGACRFAKCRGTTGTR